MEASFKKFLHVKLIMARVWQFGYVRYEPGLNSTSTDYTWSAKLKFGLHLAALAFVIICVAPRQSEATYFNRVEIMYIDYTLVAILSVVVLVQSYTSQDELIDVIDHFKYLFEVWNKFKLQPGIGMILSCVFLVVVHIFILYGLARIAVLGCSIRYIILYYYVGMYFMNVGHLIYSFYCILYGKSLVLYRALRTYSHNIPRNCELCDDDTKEQVDFFNLCPLHVVKHSIMIHAHIRRTIQNIANKYYGLATLAFAIPWLSLSHQIYGLLKIVTGKEPITFRNLFLAMEFAGPAMLLVVGFTALSYRLMEQDKKVASAMHKLYNSIEASDAIKTMLKHHSIRVHAQPLVFDAFFLPYTVPTVLQTLHNGFVLCASVIAFH